MSSIHIKRFRVRRNKQKQWYWRAEGMNGKIVAVGEGYHNRDDCMDVVYALQETSDDTEVVIEPTSR